MTDARLRELERRWRATGRVEDEADYLRERVRAGDLDEERLGLTAYLGHEAARRVSPTEEVEDPAAWLAGLCAWGDRIAVRALAAALARQATREAPEAAAELARLLSVLRTGAELPHAAEMAEWVHFTAAGMVLVRAVQELRMAPCYMRPDDPEYLPALARARAQYPLLDPGCVGYWKTVSAGRGRWGHRFHYDPPDRRGRLLPPLSAAEGWQPPPGSHRAPVGRGVFAGFAIAAIAAVPDLRGCAREELVAEALRYAT